MRYPYFLFSSLLVLSANSALATQNSIQASTHDRSSESSNTLTLTESTIHVGYQSAFTSYQPFTDKPLQDWYQANQRVHQIGGWRAYMQQAQKAKETQNAQHRSEKHDAHKHHNHGHMSGGAK